MYFKIKLLILNYFKVPSLKVYLYNILIVNNSIFMNLYSF